MPELPEVETVRRILEPQVAGARIASAWAGLARITVPDPNTFAARLAGRRILGARRHGKQLWLPLDDGANVRFHLGMTGRLEIDGSLEAGSLRSPGGGHVHGLVTLEDGRRIVFEDPRTFGLIGVAEDLAFLDGLGPDPLSGAFDPDAMASRMRGRSVRVKAALLDQALVAGIGNIYADEICFLAGVHPERRASAVSLRRLRVLAGHVRPVLERAIAAHGATIETRRYQDIFGDTGEFQPAVYGREGEPCRVCGTRVRRGVAGGRSHHWCPRCQR